MRTDVRRRGLVAALGLVAGCSDSSRAQIRGVVTFDGQPISTGMIAFRPEGKDGPTAATGIGPDGSFEVVATPGTMVVSIEATKVIGQRKAYDTPNSPMLDIVKDYVPDRYNKKTELRADLKSGQNECNFDLKSKP